MSDYLTPRQVEVYELLIKKLLEQPYSPCDSRQDWSEFEYELLATLTQELGGTLNRNGPISIASCSFMASYVRNLITKSNSMMQVNPVETSPGLEKPCTMEKSVATVYSLVNTLAATDSLYSILLKIYDHPDIACRGHENIWMMDIHIGNAVRNYASQERANIVAFLKGFPQQPEPGNDF